MNHSTAHRTSVYLTNFNTVLFIPRNNISHEILIKGHAISYVSWDMEVSEMKDMSHICFWHVTHQLGTISLPLLA